MAKVVLDDLERVKKGLTKFSEYKTRKAKVGNLMLLSSKVLPDYGEFFKTIRKELNDLDLYDVEEAVKYILEIIKVEKAGESRIKKMKLFESANEKMKQAALSFRKEDYPSSFHNLNTALELVLKDKIGIPTTITKINTSRIIDILTKHKVKPFLFLSEAKKRVVLIDNKIKHQAYSPSKIDCINGIKAMEELISKLRDKEIKLTDEIKNKIYEGL